MSIASTSSQSTRTRPLYGKRFDSRAFLSVDCFVVVVVVVVFQHGTVTDFSCVLYFSPDKTPSTSIAAFLVGDNLLSDGNRF
mmetsp:Transcript_4225/g.12143  ORF Transcript_4225/g.12143 Transcript_4225/m.12143 type:complete len:82 (-) Transcript_4225:92-337(-)